MTLPQAASLLLGLLCAVFLLVFLFHVRPRGFGESLRPAGGTPVPSPPDTVSWRALLWILIPLGAVCFGAGLRAAWREAVPRRWTPVAGKLMDVEVAAVTEKRHDLFRRQISVRRYRARVAYAYTFAGRTYDGERMSLADDSDLWRWSAERRVRGWEKGDRVIVSVNPADPAEAVLRPGVRLATVLGTAVGALLGALGLWILWSG